MKSTSTACATTTGPCGTSSWPSCGSPPWRGKVRISEENAGLHFLLELDTQRSDEDIRAAAEREDLRLSFVSQYYVSDQNRRPHVLVMNYSGLEERQIPEAVARLCRAVEG